jgi:hypothetical protein
VFDLSALASDPRAFKSASGKSLARNFFGKQALRREFVECSRIPEFFFHLSWNFLACKCGLQRVTVALTRHGSSLLGGKWLKEFAQGDGQTALDA